MNFEKIIKQLSTCIAGFIMFALAAGVYLNIKGFGFDANGNIALINSAHAAEPELGEPRTLAPNVVIPGGRSLGSQSAPVTIYEYSSLGCTHCAYFHLDTLPLLEKSYIKQGKVRLVFSSFPLDKSSLKAAMLAACMPNDKYFDFINLLFEHQRSWGLAFNTEKALAQYAEQTGMSQDKAYACMQDKQMAQELVDRRQRAIQTIKIQGTPTFVIATRDSREVIFGAPTFEELKTIIDKKLKQGW